MKKICVTILTVFIAYAVNAQLAPIAKVSATGSTALYTSLAEAVNAANDNDILYLPGGSFTGNVDINKKISIIGVGHYPDSSTATGITYIEGNLTIKAAGSGTVLDGFYLSEDVLIYPDMVTDLQIYRVNLAHVRVGHDGASTFGTLRNMILKYSIVREDIYMDYNSAEIYNTNAYNCIFGYGQIRSQRYSNFFNCIFLGNAGSGSTFNDAAFENIVFNNCIFLAPGGVTTTNYIRNYNNCSFANANNGNPAFNHCFFSKVQPNIFIKQSGTAFQYADDYHLTNGFLANIGNDSTQIGIYGTTQPFTNGALPPTPHIMKKTVAATTTGGTLNVKFSVRVPQ